MAKRKLGIVATLAVLAAVAWYLNRGVAAPTKAAPQGDLACHTYEEPKKEVKAAAEVPTLKDKKASTYKVLEVIDGDTIKVAKNGETNVRLLGMDTPEKSTTRYGHAEFYGQEAARYAQSLIEASGWEVRLTYDATKKDKYDRDLAYVWLKDGRMLNAVMVADGYAYSYTSFSPKPTYADTFVALMRSARAANKGLWSSCN